VTSDWTVFARRLKRLRGSIQVQSEQGQGTIFRIRVPISLSVVRALTVRAGDQYYAIPFDVVVRPVELRPDDIIAKSIDGAKDGQSQKCRVASQPAARRSDKSHR